MDAWLQAEIEDGYLLKPSAWGRGYATEITKRLLRFAFEETPLAEVVGVIDVDHVASGKALRKAGLSDIGLRRAYATEVRGFRVTRDAWLRQTGLE